MDDYISRCHEKYSKFCLRYLHFKTERTCISNFQMVLQQHNANYTKNLCNYTKQNQTASEVISVLKHTIFMPYALQPLWTPITIKANLSFKFSPKKTKQTNPTKQLALESYNAKEWFAFSSRSSCPLLFCYF